MAFSPDVPAQTPPFRLGQLLQAFAYAADLAFGQKLEDGNRSCFLAVKLAEELRLGDIDRETIYYASLLKHGGCTCADTSLAGLWRTNEIEARRDLFLDTADGRMSGFLLWLARYPGSGLPPPSRFNAVARTVATSTGVFRETLTGTAEVCSRISRRLGMSDAIQETLANSGEEWDGKGFPRGLKADEIPVTTQVVQGALMLQLIHGLRGRNAAASAARAQRDKTMSPAVADAFLELAVRDDFWGELESETISETVLALEPASRLDGVSDSLLDDAAYAFADFIDLKSPFTAAHSRRVGDISAQIAILMGCHEGEVQTIRRGALMHDLGIVAVPAFVLNRPEARLSATEREMIRLHPYHGERILDRAPLFAAIKPVVGSHHERVDGQGYFRGLRDREIPLGARIVAVADRLDELTHERPDRAALTITEALDVLSREAGSVLDSDIVRAVSHSLGHKARDVATQRSWPAGLSDREVEVLRHTASGLTRKDVARRLSISENTVKHHLDHIYTKTGCASKVAATLFAMENDLLP